ncbi:hypothetical protein BDZ97DRAFT_1913813 [Flammula alnicola]|nr:hypothetical protein BDZ97DRAFT_1913813 [Flammula alnicola]
MTDPTSLFKNEGRSIVAFERRGENWASPHRTAFPLSFRATDNQSLTQAHETQQIAIQDREKPTILARIAKVAIATTIFFAATYGEGAVKYFALFALIVVYLTAVG